MDEKELILKYLDKASKRELPIKEQHLERRKKNGTVQS